MKLLLLEDDKTTVECLQLCWQIIAPMDELVAVSEGKEAIRRLKHESFDAALIDLGLPDMDGIEVIARLRTFSRIPVVVVSAKHSQQDIAKAMEAGTDAYITKPFDYKNLQQRVKNLLDRHPS
jgi:two-component system KDP operon response regulator KdpE